MDLVRCTYRYPDCVRPPSLLRASNEAAALCYVLSQTLAGIHAACLLALEEDSFLRLGR